MSADVTDRVIAKLQALRKGEQVQLEEDEGRLIDNVIVGLRRGKAKAA